jgi:AraC family transcriptional regulator of adaptative response / DNA-3-methyladenine glycosylase II
VCTVAIGSQTGWVRVTQAEDRDALVVQFAPSLTPVLAPLLARLRNLFDLNARPDLIAAHLCSHERLAAAVAACPGLRVPGAFSGFELAWRAILGQRVSVRAATTLAGRLATEFGACLETPDPELNRLTPDPERIAGARLPDLVRLGIVRERALAIRELARAVAEGRVRLESGTDPAAAVEQLKEFPGIGEWTAQYIAMRALAWPDAFPHGDLGLLRGLGESSAVKLRALAEAWRPWRAYAAMHVWNGLGPPATKERP